MIIPNDVRQGLRNQLWKTADEIGWDELSLAEKTAFYDRWTRDPVIGGLLSNYMDQREVRVYIKDTILKGYSRSRLSSPERILRILAIQPTTSVAEVFERPHGILFEDRRLISWGKATDWKAILMSLYERSFRFPKSRPFAAVLFAARGRYGDSSTKAMVEGAARKLDVEHVVWLS